MVWISKRILILLFGLMLVCGAVVLWTITRHGNVTLQSATTWGSVGTVADNAANTPLSAPVSSSTGHYNPTDVPLPLIASSLPPDTAQTNAASNNAAYTDFVAQLLHGVSTSSHTTTGTTTPLVPISSFSAIPALLMATVDAQPARDDVQQALYDYGNEAGTIIQNYDNTHTNQAVILQDEAQDRTNLLKRAALHNVGADLVSVGKQLAAITNVPSQAADANTALAASYKDIGEKLIAVANTQRDDDFIKAVLTYDATADVFVKKYVALAYIFKTANVTFNKDDQGSVFMFSQ